MHLYIFFFFGEILLLTLEDTVKTISVPDVMSFYNCKIIMRKKKEKEKKNPDFRDGSSSQMTRDIHTHD